MNSIKIRISKFSKKIIFKGNGYNEEIFIVNKNQILYLLNLFHFKKYKIKKNNVEYKNIISDYLDFDEIIYCENDLDEKDFKTANKIIQKDQKIVMLSSLSLSFYDYQKNSFSKIDGEFELTEERKLFFKKLEELINEKNFIPICGPKYIGKSISILYFLKIYIQSYYFYINLSYCKKLFLENRNECFSYISKELYYCLTFDNVQKIYNYISKNNYKNIMEIIVDIMNYLDINFPYKSFYFVLDQYKQKIDINYEYIKKIKLKSEENMKFTVIVCSSINEHDFRNSLDAKLNKKNDFYLNYLYVNKLICVGQNKIKDFDSEEKDLLNRAGNLFIYYQQILDNNHNRKKKDFRYSGRNYNSYK